MRCANDGHCLLVDYEVSMELSVREHLFGHGCYTKKQGMLIYHIADRENFLSFQGLRKIPIRTTIRSPATSI